MNDSTTLFDQILVPEKHDGFGPSATRLDIIAANAGALDYHFSRCAGHRLAMRTFAGFRGALILVSRAEWEEAIPHLRLRGLL